MSTINISYWLNAILGTFFGLSNSVSSYGVSSYGVSTDLVATTNYVNTRFTQNIGAPEALASTVVTLCIAALFTNTGIFGSTRKARSLSFGKSEYKFI